VRSTTIETTDALLAASLRRAILEPSPESYRALAAEYRRLGVFDRAQSYLEKAQGLAPKDAATYDALARLWRDAGFPRFGLADATRAVFFAPESPAAHNTLGTILQALGQRTLAIAEYERALALDAEASYALNNLCYAWMLERQTERAITACRQALAIEPSMSAARNNLALAYASAGRSDMARATFEESGDKAAAKFNLGIMHLAQGDYRSAVNDFVQAHQLRPSMVSALARARQAAALASSGE
jgi:tetratricopeptide (TPR) repeat protein